MAPAHFKAGVAVATLSSICALCSGAKTLFTDTYVGLGKFGGTETYTITGFEDPASTRPLHFHMPGANDPFFLPYRQTSATFMYNQGYVSASMGYGNKAASFCYSICGDDENSNCTLASPTPKASMKMRALSIKAGVDKLCSRSTVDCTQGVAVSGFSFGSFMAQLLPHFDARVTAILVIGTGMYAPLILGGSGINTPALLAQLDYSCITDPLFNSVLPKSKRRYLNGAADVFFTGGTELFGLKNFSGYDCGTSKDCIQSDGSGFYMTQTSDFSTADTTAYVGPAFLFNGHYNFITGLPVTNMTGLLPTFETGSAKWSLTVIYGWLAGAARVAPSPSASPSPSPAVSMAAGKHGIVGMCAIVIAMTWMV